MKKIIGSLLLVPIIFFTFFAMTSLTQSEIFKLQPQVSDITSLIAAWTSILAIFGAGAAYYNWLGIKIRDDTYALMKKYVAHMSEIEYEAIDLFTSLDGLIPQDHLLPVRKDEALEALEDIANRISKIDTAVRLFHTASLEFEYWDIKLTGLGEKLHHEIMQGTWDFAIQFRKTLDEATLYYLERTELTKLRVEQVEFKNRTMNLRASFNERREAKFARLFKVTH